MDASGRLLTAAAATAVILLDGGECSRAVAAPPVAEEPVPPFIGGILARPSCEAAEEVSFETRSFGLSRAADGTLTGYRYERFVFADGWVLAQTNRGATFQRETAPGVIEVAVRRDGMAAVHDGAPDEDSVQGEGWEVRTYRRCASLPPELRLIHGEAATAMAALDRIEANCRNRSEDACGAAVLAAVDVSSDGLLTVSELSRVVRVGLYLLAAADAIGGGEAIGEEALLSAQGAGVLLAPPIARAALDSFDYDGDQRLSPAELLQDRGGVADIAAGALAATSGRPELMAAIGRLRALGDLIEMLMR